MYEPLRYYIQAVSTCVLYSLYILFLYYRALCMYVCKIIVGWLTRTASVCVAG